MKAAAFTLLLCLSLPLAGQGQGPVALPGITVYSPRVANQAPAGTFAMPVSALRFEPGVDLQPRNLAEGQADVTLRGGIFESTGFKLGATTILDPQTGHYLADIPVAPVFLAAPEILAGADLALGVTNATAGAVAYGWRPIQSEGNAVAGGGAHHLQRAEVYQGFAGIRRVGGWRVAADVAAGFSKSDGALPFGDHRFDRINARLQLTGAKSQTDLFAGYQAKFFGWPNLYTPFNSNETENLQTVLFILNHRTDLGGGDFLEAGAFHRRNKDDYAFNRQAAVGAVHPFQHTTWLQGLAAGGRRTFGGLALNSRFEIFADELRSTSLTWGSFNSRTIARLAIWAEKTWQAADATRTVVRAGATYDDSNRDRGTLSPVAEVAREFPSGTVQRLYASHSRTSQLPTYTALNANAAAGLFRGNPKLGRQVSRNYEVGASGALAGGTARLAAFWRGDDGLVDWTFRRGVTARTANPVDLEIAGFEAVWRKAWPSAEVILGYTGIGKLANYRGAPVDASFYALNYSRHRVTAATTFHLGHGIELRLDNAARRQAPNFLRTAGGSEALVTCAGLKYRPPAARRWELSLQVDDVWNSRFQAVPAVPAAGRQSSLGVAHSW